MKRGKVWLVGAGPGDPGLITVRGRELLERADAVLFDALSHPALLDHCRPDAELRDVGKRGGRQSPDQTWITEQLLELARAGKNVVRLKGGDSFLFARGAEEAQALAAAGVDFEVVPGLSSPVGTSAYAGISLTHRNLSSSVTFITGSDRAGKEWSPDAWRKLATATDTICVLMGMARIGEIARALIEGGRSERTPAAVVRWGARPEQQVLTAPLGQIAEAATAKGLKNPAVIIVGEVVRLREDLRWFDTRPLFGRRVLVPRPAHQARDTARAIRERAAEPVLFPVIEICDPPDLAPLEQACSRLADYDQVVFTSANGVERFFAAVQASGRDARALGNCKIAVIGPKTAQALKRYGLTADLVAKDYVGESLAQELIAAAPKRVLMPRALVARDTLPELLRQAGMAVDVVPAYETRPASAERAAELLDGFRSHAVDVVLFTSSSTVQSLVNLLGADAKEMLASVRVASIGPITTKTAEDLGLTVAVTASVYTVEGLLDALEEHYSEIEKQSD